MYYDDCFDVNDAEMGHKESATVASSMTQRGRERITRPHRGCGVADAQKGGKRRM